MAVKKNTLTYVIITAIITLILTTFTVGGGVYFWQKSIADENEANLKQQIENLEEEFVRQKVVAEQNEASLRQQIEDLEQKLCKGTWINGVCTQKTCVDSDESEGSNDIYTTGNITVADETGLSRTIYDECNGSKTQVNEMWCVESPKGSSQYLPGKLVHNCPNGCFDGACKREK